MRGAGLKCKGGGIQYVSDENETAVCNEASHKSLQQTVHECGHATCIRLDVMHLFVTGHAPFYLVSMNSYSAVLWLTNLSIKSGL